MNQRFSRTLHTIGWIGLAAMLSACTTRMPTVEQQVQGFADAVNANDPEMLYTYLAPELRAQISQDEFARRFEKERSYPYLSPLYVYVDEITLDPETRQGRALLTVAARLPGQKMTVGVVHTPNGYFVSAFDELVDESYLEKFDRLSPMLMTIKNGR